MHPRAILLRAAPPTMDILDAATILERFGLGGPLPPNASDLCKYLGLQEPVQSSPNLLLDLHERLSLRLLAALEPHYEVEPIGADGLGLRPKVGVAQVGVLALHGAQDTGRRFAAVFYELLQAHAIHLVSPTWTEATKNEVVEQAMGRLVGQPVVVVGLSAGANTAWELGDTLAKRILGIVAFAAAPWRCNVRLAHVPTLFVHGIDDRLFPIEHVRAFVAGQPESEVELREILGIGHAFPYRLVEGVGWPWMVEKLRSAIVVGD